MILYHYSSSSHSRFVLLVARELEIDLEIRELGLCNGEQYGEEFSKINPLHQIPVLIDGDFKLTESRAIGCYLANLHPQCNLYPIEPRKRAVVDQMLYLDATYIIPTWYTKIIVPIIRGTSTSVSSEDREEVKTMLINLELILEKSLFFAGDKITLADLSILGSVAFLHHVKMNLTEFPNLTKWYESLKTLKGFEESDSGAKTFAVMFEDVWKKTS